MTTALVRAKSVIDMCDAAEKKVRLLIANSPVKEPPEPGDRADFFLPDPEKYAQYNILKLHYKDLNFILRLKEISELAKEYYHLSSVNLSLQDYSRLMAIIDKQLVYSPENPLNK